jgi:hypothetical protein
MYDIFMADEPVAEPGLFEGQRGAVPGELSKKSSPLLKAVLFVPSIRSSPEVRDDNESAPANI